MFAKQTLLSASLVALCGRAQAVRAEGDVSPQSEGEVQPVADVADVPEPQDLPPEHPVVRSDPRQPTGRFTLGAGYADDEGFIASATIAQDDLFHTGNQLSMHARLSERRQLFLLRFADPDVLGSKLGLSADIYNDRRQRPGFAREAADAPLTLAHPLGEHLRGFVGYRIEEIDVSGDSLWAARTIDPQPPLVGGTLSALRAGLVYDTRDRADAPLHGTSIGASVVVADRSLGSDFAFTRTQAWAQHHRPLGPFTLHLSGSITTLTGGVPRSERLFLDSAMEIRGYHPDSFGPVDSLGTPVGGETKLLGSAELEVPLVRRLGLSAVGFADVGGLYDRGGQGQLGRSVGVGLLWRSPIGLMRFSWAVPLDGGTPGFVFGVGL